MGVLASHTRTLFAVQCTGAFEHPDEAVLYSYRIQSMTRDGVTRTIHLDNDPSNLDNCENVYDKTYRTRRPCLVVTWSGKARLDWAPDKAFSLVMGTGPCDFPDSWAQKGRHRVVGEPGRHRTLEPGRH